MAVKGIDIFKKYFSGFNENYIIIGKTACSIILRDSDIRPGATKDIDMILVVEQMTPEFGRQFWRFIKDGDYTTRERKRDEGKDPVLELFRFSQPKNEGFPFQIELLSKYPDIFNVPADFQLAPTPISFQYYPMERVYITS